MFQKILWKITGADIEILSKSRSDWNRFTSLGLGMLFSSILSAITMSASINIICNNYLIVFPLGILWGIVILSINRHIAFGMLDNSSIVSKIMFTTLRVLLSAIIGLTISAPTLLELFKDIIAQKTQSTDFFGRIAAFHEIMNENPRVQIMSYLITILIFLIELCPLVLLWTMKKGVYEEIMQEFKRFEIENAKLQNKETLELASMKIQKREEKRRMPFGGFELYIDYKRLQMNDINILLSALNGLYNAIYKIEVSSVNKFTTDYINEEIFKIYPEDTLLIHSIETGDSITIKVTTGWKPKIEIIESNFIISLPKGAITLLVTGYLITKIFDYGISNYKQILEIKKLEKENAILNNKLYEKELESFNSKLERSAPDLKENFHIELSNFYNLTISNTNYNQLRLTQDTIIKEKMDKGELFIE